MKDESETLPVAKRLCVPGEGQSAGDLGHSAPSTPATLEPTEGALTDELPFYNSYGINALLVLRCYTVSSGTP